MRVLNITNGDGAGERIKASSAQGDVLSWRDPMHHGPFASDMSLDAVRSVRARYLAGPDGDVRAAERDFALRDEHLKAAETYSHVVLWFEHDLLDQLQLLQIMDWWASDGPGDTRLEIICINQFPCIEVFRGIGQLSPDQMGTLVERAEVVTPEMLRLAQVGWQAFGSSDPTDVLRFAQGDLPGLPFMRAALMRHLEELPWAHSGLTRTEHQLLGLVSEGVNGPVDLFWRNMDLETALFMGDWPTYRVLGRLCDAGLLATDGGDFLSPSFEPEDQAAFQAQTLRLTNLGQSVLDGSATAFTAMPYDHWLGGVHVKTGQRSWLWDAALGTPVLQDL